MRTSRSFAVAIAVVFVAFGWPAGAQSERTGKRPNADGIEVHGDWTIEIKNPDGSLAGRHQFKNALVSSGAQTLAGLLHGTAARGRWFLLLGGATSPCQQNGGCFLVEVGAVGAPAPNDGPLSVAPVGSDQVRLNGSLTAVRDGQITYVASALGVESTPGNFPSYPTFSQRSLPSPIQVVAGQSVAITVVFSFS